MLQITGTLPAEKKKHNSPTKLLCNCHLYNISCIAYYSPISQHIRKEPKLTILSIWPIQLFVRANLVYIILLAIISFLIPGYKHVQKIIWFSECLSHTMHIIVQLFYYSSNFESVSLTTLGRLSQNNNDDVLLFSAQCFLIETPYCLQNYSIQAYLKTITIFPKAPLFYPCEQSRPQFCYFALSNSNWCTPGQQTTNCQWNTGMASASSTSTLWDTPNGNQRKVLASNTREHFSDNPIGNALCNKTLVRQFTLMHLKLNSTCEFKKAYKQWGNS